MDYQESDKSRICLLDGLNVTPPSRTPWGGRAIAALKADVGDLGDEPIGESWELSVEPDFPSRVKGQDFQRILNVNSAYWLGEEHHAGRRGTALLVKLLDAQTPLSVQIHPADDDPVLTAKESGKPESWYVFDHVEGAGLYLGFEPGVSAEEVRRVLEEDGDLRPLLHFVPVRVGDFFVIAARTPHCVGAGVTLVEPQHVLPGKRGQTYRYWDWGRRYNATGHPDPRGKPRVLHRERALAITDWTQHRGAQLLTTTRCRTGAPEVDGPLQIERLCGPTNAALHSAHLQVARITGTGQLPDLGQRTLTALTVLDGEAHFGSLRIARGRTAAIPAGESHHPIAGKRLHAILSSVAVPPT